MENEFIPYEQALALKELGFNEPCICGYSKSTEQLEIYSRFLVTKDSFTVDAPTFLQAFRFFREKYSLYSHVRESYAFDNTLQFVTQINGSYVDHGIKDKPFNRFETYEEAELECLKKLIEIVKAKS